MRDRAHRRFEQPAMRMNPITHGIRRHLQSQRPTVLATALIAGGVAFAPAVSQAQAVLEEIIVTATKREENLQNVPISLQALDSTRLRELGIQSFDDYVLKLPSLSFRSNGPGLNTIYMRGVSDGGDGNPSGSSPSVGLYLDEQPVTSIHSNLDVHIYDIARIEALAGPQGTLYGASAQSGTLRIISNQPQIDEFEGRFDVGAMSTQEGDPSYSVEAMVNVPLGDKAALRLVGWYIDEGGYIDNVAGTRTYDLTGPYGGTVAVGRTGTIDNRNFTSDDPRANAQPIAEDINTLEKTGLRALLKIDLNDAWTATVGILYQNMQTEGVWDHDPLSLDPSGSPIGDYNIQRYYQDTNDDEFTQYSLVLEGDLGDAAHLTYAFSLLDRQNDYVNDYTEYGQSVGYVPYYSCDYTATGTAPGPFVDNSDCTNLDEFVFFPFDMTRQTHELRVSSSGDGAFRYTAGVFWNEYESDFRLNYIQPHMSPNATVISPFDPGTNLYFLTRQLRTDSQQAVFGELTWAFNDQWSATVGGRYYETEHEMIGEVTFGPAGFGGILSGNSNQSESQSDFLSKFNVSWNATDDVMVYFTRAEGYRPGGVNRDPLLIPKGFGTFDQDFLTSYEVGFKSTLADGRLRLNGAIYSSDWEDVQYTIYNFSISACCGTTYNLGDAEVTGVELDMTFAATDNFMLYGSIASTSAKSSEDFILDPTDQALLQVPKGQPLPNVPDLKFNLTGRYDFTLGSNDAYAQLSYVYVDETTNRIVPSDPLFTTQDSYSIVNIRAGMLIGTWNIDVFVNNATDEIAEIASNLRAYGTSTIINRPLSVGFRLGKSF